MKISAREALSLACASLSLLAAAAAIAEPQRNRSYPPAPAENDWQLWVTPDDYPEHIDPEEASGATFYRLLVNPDGTPTDCQVTSSTATSDMDAFACEMLLERARFVSGRQPVRQFTSSVIWGTPEARQARAETQRLVEAEEEADERIRTRGERFGAWYVRRTSDELDPTSRVVLYTEARAEDGLQNAQFTFVIYGGNRMSFILPGSSARTSWPFCEQEGASYLVDEGPASYLTNIDVAGGCDRISMNGTLISRFQSGNSARFRIGGFRDYQISLDGFTAAYRRARLLAR